MKTRCAALCALLLMLTLAACQAADSGAWERLGGVNGSVMLSIAVEPFAHKLLYVGTSDGRVVRVRVDSPGSADGPGLPLPDTTVSVLAADPAHAGVVYAGTNRGLYISPDYGDSWRARGSGLPKDDPPEALAFGAVSGGAAPLYVGTQQHGAYVSHDGGTTWVALGAGLPASANIYSLTFDASTGTLLAALTAGDGIYALPAAGQRWVARGAGLPASADVFTVAAVPAAARGTSATLYAGTSAGLYASADHGATWHAAGLAGARVLALAADPVAPGALYAGTDSTVYRSPDGATWSEVAPGIAGHVPALAVVADAHQHAVVFAGSSSILRYPALPGGSGSDALGNVLGLLIFVALGGTVFYLFRRSLRQLRTAEAHQTAERLPADRDARN
ncbi:MAG TPA: hypothetical protein VGR57_00095 [Ktedonobacterales bacterium]|nr:hypothetical protein [Ktedonobacterales bacterium]